MKKLLTTLLICFALSASADNPPYPCDITWQQGGIMFRGDLYQNGFKMPKRDQDIWQFTNIRPGYNFSYGWYHLVCGPDMEQENLPLDTYTPILGIALVLIVFRRKINIKNLTNLNYENRRNKKRAKRI
ncbi:MAG: hypothetical protein V4608_14870 [Bacteroidota bacterium]